MDLLDPKDISSMIERFEIVGSTSARPDAQRIIFCDGTGGSLFNDEKPHDPDKGTSAMNRRCFLTLPAVLLPTSAFGDEVAPPGDKPAITVSIAIPVHHGHRSLDAKEPFHVLVTNTSEKTVRLWTDRYSWGYHNLLFEHILEDGTVIAIKKKARGWTKNFPDWLELQPVENYVLNVQMFGSDVWDNALTPKTPNQSNDPKLVKLRAVYEIEPDDESRKHDVWTGKVESQTGTYAVW